MNQQRALLIDMYSRPASWQRGATRIDSRTLGLTVGLLVLLTCAGLLYLSQASTAAELRYILRERQGQEQVLQEQITVLRCQIALGESITSLEPRAERLGLVDASPGDPQVVCYVPMPAPPVLDASQVGLRKPARPAQVLPAFWEWLCALLRPAARIK